MNGARLIEGYIHDPSHQVNGSLIEYPNGIKKWQFDNKLHRIDGPAIEWPDGEKHWYINGNYHRVDGPAVECSNGVKHWYINGKRHRADGPAVVYSNGTREWYLNGKQHRVDGPAVEYASGTKKWYLDDKLHRVDGPAIEFSDGTKYWYLNGWHIKQYEYYAFLSLRKIHSKIVSLNEAFGFDLAQILKLSQNKTIVEWYYSPNNGGGKLAKKRLGYFCRSIEPINFTKT